MSASESTATVGSSPVGSSPVGSSPVGSSTASDTSEIAVLHHNLVRVIRTLRTTGQGNLSAGVSSGLWSIIHHGPLRLSELADREAVAMPTMSRIVAALEQQGYVERTPDPDDGRARLLVATSAGTELINNARSAKAQLLGAALEQLDVTTRTQLHQGLAALADALSASSTDEHN